MTKQMCVVTMPTTIRVLVEIKEDDDDTVAVDKARAVVDSARVSMPGILLAMVGDAKVLSVAASDGKAGKSKSKVKEEDENEPEEEEDEPEEEEDEDEDEDEPEEEEDEDEDEKPAKKSDKKSGKDSDKKSDDGKKKIKIKLK